MVRGRFRPRIHLENSSSSLKRSSRKTVGQVRLMARKDRHQQIARIGLDVGKPSVIGLGADDHRRAAMDLADEFVGRRGDDAERKTAPISSRLRSVGDRGLFEAVDTAARSARGLAACPLFCTRL